MARSRWSTRSSCPLILSLLLRRGRWSSLSSCALAMHVCKASRKLSGCTHVPLALWHLMARSLGVWGSRDVVLSSMRIWLRVVVVLSWGGFRWRANESWLGLGCGGGESVFSRLRKYEIVLSWCSHKGRRKICIDSSMLPNWGGLK